jgi:hypothetical protein
MLIKQIHGLVHILQVQRCTGGHIDLLKPSVSDTQFALWLAESIGNHSQQRPFISNVIAESFTYISEGLSDTQSLPQGFKSQGGSTGKGLYNFEILSQPHKAIQNCALTICQRIDHLQAADPGNGLTEPDKLNPVQLICSAEAVDNVSDGLFGDGMSLIVSELIVGNNRAVFVFSAGSSEVHSCLPIYHVCSYMSMINIIIVCLQDFRLQDSLARCNHLKSLWGD